MRTFSFDLGYQTLSFALRKLAIHNHYYDIQGVYNHLVRFLETKDDSFETPYVAADTTLNLVSSIVDQLIQIKDKYPDLYQFEMKARDKWLGPQGGISTWKTQSPSVYEYLAAPEAFDSSFLSAVRKDVIEYIGTRISDWGMECLYPYSNQTLYDTYRGMKKSNSGIFYWKDRRAPNVRWHSYNASLESPYSMDPVVTGQRKQRNKVRDIFMDTMPNLYRFNRVLRPLHDFLAVRTPHIAWRGDHYDEKHIYQWIGNRRDWWSLESDVDSMDKRMSLEVTQYVMGELLSLPFVSPELREEYLKYIELTFSIPILSPDGLLEGRKRLLSGLPPTNDYESFVNWYVLASFLHTHRNKMRGSLKDIDHFIIVKGDDSSILFSEDVSTVIDQSGQTVSITAAIAAWYNKFRLLAKAEKQAFRHRTTMFCKRFYYPTLTQYKDIAGSIHSGSAYSLLLAINSIVYPEILNHPKDAAYQMTRILQILDNVRFHPLWKTLVNRLVELQVLPLVKLSEETVEYFNATERDWRWHLYGEKFTLGTSPTYAYISSRIPLAG